MQVKKGDTVLVLSGKDRGKKGKVIQVIPKKDKLRVEGINMVKKHQKAQGQVMQAGIVPMEAAMPKGKVMLLCPHCNQPSRIVRHPLESGKNGRFCRRCGEIVDR